MIETMLKQNNTLQINVAQLLKSLIGTTRTYSVEEEVDIAGKNRVVHGDIELTRSDRSILVHGVLHVDVELNCGRCASEFIAPLTLDIQEEYFPKIDVFTGDAAPAPEEDREAFSIDERNILDLLEAVQQYALMAQPIKPLCKPDCAGLCPTCGHNLNQGACPCPPDDIDPRWDKLRQSFSNRK
jgi:uncharacterized protein